MKSIVVVSPETLPVPPSEGGAVQTVIFEQSKRIKDAKIKIICPRGSKEASEEIDDHLSFEWVQSTTGSKNIKRDLYIQRVIRAIKEEKPAIIHLHNRPEFIKPLSTAFPKSKLILHMHNDHLRKVNLKELKKIGKKCWTLVFVSHFLMKRVLKRLPILKQKSKVVYNGIDLSRFCPAKDVFEVMEFRKQLGIHPKDVTLLYVGRIVPQKGLLEIIQAMQKLVAGRNRVKLLVVGASHFGSDQMNEYERRVRNLAKEIAQHVKFIGYVPQNEIAKYYCAADVFLSPVRWKEPFGLVIGEAAASGLPIVATRNGAIPEIIQHKKNGWLISPNYTTNELIRSLRKIVFNRPLRKRMRKSARKRIENYFTWDKSAFGIAEIYKKG